MQRRAHLLLLLLLLRPPRLVELRMCLMLQGTW
jgi:hypothetical protein